jgi:hypothetical protein
VNFDSTTDVIVDKCSLPQNAHPFISLGSVIKSCESAPGIKSDHGFFSGTH